MPSLHLFCRAEVVLGNIIKKKGWRYDAHLNWVWCFLISVPASLLNLVSSPSLHILGRLYVVNWNSKVGRWKINAGRRAMPTLLCPSSKMLNNGWTASALSSTLSVLDWHLCSFVRLYAYNTHSLALAEFWHSHTYCGMWVSVTLEEKGRNAWLRRGCVWAFHPVNTCDIRFMYNSAITNPDTSGFLGRSSRCLGGAVTDVFSFPTFRRSSLVITTKIFWGGK